MRFCLHRVMKSIIRLFSNPLLLLLSILGATIGFFIGPAFVTAATIGFIVFTIFRAIKQNKFHLPPLPFQLLFLLYIIVSLTIVQSENINFGFTKIILYLPIWIIPLALAQAQYFLQTRFIQQVIIISTATFMLALLGVEVLVYGDLIEIETWKGDAFPLAYHHIRFAMMFLCLSLFSWKYMFNKNPVSAAIFWIIIGILLHLTSIRSAWLGYYILSLYPLLQYWTLKSISKKRKQFIQITIGLGLLVIGLVLWKSTVVQDKFNYMKWAYQQNYAPTETLPDQSRVEAAKLAIQFMKIHPFGVGLGDFKQEFIQLTKETEVSLKQGFLPHSQSLIHGLIGGWPLLILSLCSFLYMIIWALRKRNYLLLVLSLFFFLLLNIEPLLDTQAGIIPFVLFLGLAAMTKKRASLS